MDTTELEERRLQEQLSALRLEVKKKRRVLFLTSYGVLGSLLVVAMCVSTRPRELSPMELYGIFPIVLFLVFGAVIVIVGWLVDSAENRAHQVEWEIRSLHEVDG